MLDMTATPRGVPLPGGIAPFVLIPGGLLVSLQCPHCGTWIRHLFHRVRVAVSNSHPRPGKRDGMCNVIVVPDPKGDEHMIYRVAIDADMKRAMQLVCERLGSAA